MIDRIHQAMQEKELDLLIVGSTDEHLNEYLPAQNCRLEISTSSRENRGFSGSAGTAIFCIKGRSQLFVDSRYHIQAEETCGENFDIQKMGYEGVPSPQGWIKSLKKNNLIIGADPIVMCSNEWRS